MSSDSVFCIVKVSGFCNLTRVIISRTCDDSTGPPEYTCDGTGTGNLIPFHSV